MSFIRKFVKGICLFIDPDFPGPLFNASDKTDGILKTQLIKRSHIINDKFLHIRYLFLELLNTKMCKTNEFLT